MRKLNQSRLEMYVENYLRYHQFRKNIKNVNFLRKVKVWIEQKLELDTCSYDEPVQDLYTLQDNQFTRTVWNMLINMSRNKYRVSLERTKDLNNNYINTCC
jgi:hypothetical protein